MKHFISENINGILGTTIFHLILIMAFLFVKIGKVREFHKEKLEIEFTNEMTPIEEIIQTPDILENLEMPSLDKQTISNIARNISEQLEQEISTDQYEKQVMKELGIESLQPETPEYNEEDRVMVEDRQPEEDPPPDKIVNTIVKDNTSVTYDLLNRWHEYIYIPTYKCEGGGTVLLGIEVDQQGAVVSVSVLNNSPTNDPCLVEEAVNSARKAVFNANPNALPRQTGIMTYVFMPQ